MSYIYGRQFSKLNITKIGTHNCEKIIFEIYALYDRIEGLSRSNLVKIKIIMLDKLKYFNQQNSVVFLKTEA